MTRWTSEKEASMGVKWMADRMADVDESGQLLTNLVTLPTVFCDLLSSFATKTLTPWRQPGIDGFACEVSDIGLSGATIIFSPCYPKDTLLRLYYGRTALSLRKAKTFSPGGKCFLSFRATTGELALRSDIAKYNSSNGWFLACFPLEV